MALVELRLLASHLDLHSSSGVLNLIIVKLFLVEQRLLDSLVVHLWLVVYIGRLFDEFVDIFIVVVIFHNRLVVVDYALQILHHVLLVGSVALVSPQTVVGNYFFEQKLGVCLANLFRIWVLVPAESRLLMNLWIVDQLLVFHAFRMPRLRSFLK